MVRGLAVALALLGAAAALQWAAPGAAPVAYDPEAWLIWGRELTAGSLDVTVGPAIKPLPMLLNAAVIDVAGSTAARSLWATIAAAGLLAAAWLAWAIVRATTGQARWAAASAALVVMTPTVVEGGLTGAAEPLALAGLLGAAWLAATGRAFTAGLLLCGIALLRPEAVPVLGGLVAVQAARAHGVRSRARILAAGAGGAALVVAPWLVLQQLGGGSLGGGVDAATALRPGQPGLAEFPAAASLLQAAVMVVPAILLAVVASRGGVGPRSSDARALGRTLVGAGALWIVTVVAMSQAGFSGEARYLAPGTATVSLGLLAGAGEAARRGQRASILAPVAITVLCLTGAFVAAGAVRGARDLARSQADLDRVLAQPSVRAAAGACERIAVPRFLRPATAWRLRLGMARIQSPVMAGSDCRLLPAGHGAPGPDWRQLARSGRWSWWRQDQPTLRTQPDP